jgi:predicted small lipoprotein YifL
MKRFAIALMMVAGLALSTAGCGKEEKTETPPAAEKTIEDRAEQAVEKTEEAAEEAAKETEEAAEDVKEGVDEATE